MARTADRSSGPPGLKEKNAFEKSLATEAKYASQLKRIAKHIGDIVRHNYDGTLSGAAKIRALMDQYAKTLEPWARAVATTMLRDVERRDYRAWRSVSRMMKRDIMKEIAQTPIGDRVRELMDQQVGLIQSIPEEAAKKVHEAVIENLENRARVPDIAKWIEGVSKARANLIARTETSRAATAFVQARAEFVGSDGYIWRTVGDNVVRPDHRELEGTFHRWDDPPVADTRNGARAHPGCIYNCRCYAWPVLRIDKDKPAVRKAIRAYEVEKELV